MPIPGEPNQADGSPTSILLPPASSQLPPGSSSSLGQLSGSLLIWHAWRDAEQAALEEALQELESAHPGLSLTAVAQDFAGLKQEFERAAMDGDGPDLLIGPGQWAAPLAAAGLLLNLDPPAAELAGIPAPAVDALRNDDGLYGLPLSLRLVALYYNAGLVQAPPTNLDELLAEGAAGRVVALNTGFYHAFWGLSAFGGHLFDSQGSSVLDEGGFAQWLAWLATAQDAPGMVLDSDSNWLQSLFTNNQAAYYVDGPWALDDLQAALGQAGVGVAPLPAGPAGPSAPLLEVEAVMVSATADAGQAQAATLLARALAGPETGIILATTGSLLSANPGIATDSDPALNGFMAQAATAIPFPDDHQMEAAWGPADAAMFQVLQGLSDADQAVAEADRLIDQALAAPAEASDASCPQEGTITLWHAWQGAEAMALEQLIDSFAARCPAIRVNALSNGFDQLQDRFLAAVRDGTGPDLIIGPGEWVGTLAGASALREIRGDLPPDALRPFIPKALDALRDAGGLYGLPESIQTIALYVNTILVDSPATTLDQLLLQAAAGQQVALNTGFYHAFWGLQAFGGRLLDDAGRSALDEDGFAAWLDWLVQAREAPGMVLDSDGTRLQELFRTGQVATLVDASWMLRDLQASLGEQVVGVAPLPAGPLGAAGPLLSVEAFMFSSAADDRQFQLALAFARHATGPEGQMLSMNLAGHVPARRDVSVPPVMAGFMQQAATSVPFPNQGQMDAVWGPGADAYSRVLAGLASGQQAAAEANAAIERAAGR